MAVNLNYPLDDGLHRRCRVAAAQQGITLKEFVVRALERAAAEAEAEAEGHRG